MRPVFTMIAAVALAAAVGHADARNGDLIPSLERLAESGSAEAIYHLGMAYQTGSGVAEDRAKALDAFRKAASLGDALGSYKLGCYYDGQGAGLVETDTGLAMRYKLVAAKAGYALAQQDVGVLYARAGDAPKGLAWLEKSADQGWPGALMTLASVYNGAAGVKPDGAKTAAYFRLFLARSEPNEEQSAWLENFEKRLSPDDRRRADDIARSYRPVPTALTLTALSGQRAARALVEAQAGK